MSKFSFNYIIVVFLLAWMSCTNANHPGRLAMEIPQRLENTSIETNKDYILQPGDVVIIKFFFNPELNERVPIRPDGKISLQLIDELVAAGRTPSELDDILSEKFSKILRYPEVSVIVEKYEEFRVYVGGEVQQPGLISSSHSLTSLQAIFQAGGPKDTAEMRTVVILRKQKDRQPLFMTIDLMQDLTIQYEKTEKSISPVQEEENTIVPNQANQKLIQPQSNDMALKPYDVVFVPKTRIAKADQFVDQYLRKLIPVNLNVGFSWVYDLNPTDY